MKVEWFSCQNNVISKLQLAYIVSTFNQTSVEFVDKSRAFVVF